VLFHCKLNVEKRKREALATAQNTVLGLARHWLVTEPPCCTVLILWMQKLLQCTILRTKLALIYRVNLLRRKQVNVLHFNLPFFKVILNYIATKIPFMYSFSGNWAASVPFSTLMCLWAIYIFSESVHIFSCSRIGRSIMGIHKSLTDTWMWKLGLWQRNSFSGNICFKFLVCVFAV
jgi:hypothetical protein